MRTSLPLALTLALAAGPAPARGEAPVALPAKAEAALRAQAARMFDAWIRGADEEFVDALYPGLVRKLGGKPAAVGIIRGQRAQLDQEGTRTLTSTTEKVRACVGAGPDLQCVVEGTQRMQTPKGILRVRTATVAFSKDGGGTWTFLSISGDADVRETFAEVSAALPRALDEDPSFEAAPAAGAARAPPATEVSP